MHAPPEPEMRRGAVGSGTPEIASLGSIHTKESDTATIDFQAQRLRRLFLFCHGTARAIAALAYGVAR